MVNGFVHVELSTTDPGKAKPFYGKLFSWKMEDVLTIITDPTGAALGLWQAAK